MPKALKSFGNAVKEFRESFGLTQEQLAEACKLHPVFISQIERGIKYPSFETILKLSKALKTTPGTLMNLAFGFSGERQAAMRQAVIALEKLSRRDLEAAAAGLTSFSETLRETDKVE